MSFEEKVRDLANVSSTQRAYLLTEEAAKTAIVLKMFQALEFDPFNPAEIIPEFTADVGIKKGEKVDYAISVDGDIVILVECKAPGTELTMQHASQLYRYFSVTDARFAVLTNGFDWDFYTDLDAPNRMDKRPFLSFNISDIDPSSLNELSKFRKSIFNLENILSTATDLKYISALKAEIKNQFEEPSAELVMLLGRKVYEGRFTAQILDQFKSLIRRSLNDVVRDKVSTRLSSALLHNTNDFPMEGDADEVLDGIETTEDEWDGFRIAVAIAAKVISPERIHIRDQKSYCGVLIDNNNRRPLIRMWFNSPTTKYLGLFDGESEEKVSVSRPTDIYKFADRICRTAEKYADL